MSDEVVPKYRMTFGSADRLGVFEQYRFFSPALPYLHGRFNDDYLLDFMRGYPAEVRLMWHKFSKPLFRGMQAPDGDREWNFGLWAVEADVYPALESFLLSVSLIDSDRKVTYRLGAQDVLIADPLRVDKRGGVIAANIPLLSVVVFGVDASYRRISVYWDDKQPTASLPEVRFNAPSERAVAFAKATFTGDNLAADAAIGLPRPVSPPDLNITNIGALPPAQQAELLREIEEYKQKDRP